MTETYEQFLQKKSSVIDGLQGSLYASETDLSKIYTESSVSLSDPVSQGIRTWGNKTINPKSLVK